jgi:hypothetical protein
MTTMSKPEIDAVREWLKGEGYPLEYEVAREMARVGYRPWRGRYYKDPETGDFREVDVQATEPDSHSSPWRPVWVVVECKHNSKPWMVLTDAVDLPPGYGRNFLVSRNVAPAQLQAADPPGATFLLTPPKRHGYGVVQTISGPDTPFAALQTVVKAAREKLASIPGRDAMGISVPIIVVDGSLYQLGFDDDGTEILEPVLWQRVVWHGSGPPPGDESRPVQVDVVTKPHLPAYLRALRAATQALATVLKGASGQQ